MFNWVLNTPLELHEKNKEKQAFLLIHCTTYTYHFLYSANIKSTYKNIKEDWVMIALEALYLVSVGTYVFSAILQRKRNYNVREHLSM